jgi:hypothetical protein
MAKRNVRTAFTEPVSAGDKTRVQSVVEALHERAARNAEAQRKEALAAERALELFARIAAAMPDVGCSMETALSEPPRSFQPRTAVYVAFALARALPVITFSHVDASLAAEMLLAAGASGVVMIEDTDVDVISRHWPLLCEEEGHVNPASQHWTDHGGHEICCGHGDDCDDVDDPRACSVPFSWGGEDNAWFDEGRCGYMQGGVCYGDCCVYAVARIRVVLTYDGCLLTENNTTIRSNMTTRETEDTAPQPTQSMQSTQAASQEQLFLFAI